jgi:hypothetical protein
MKSEEHWTERSPKVTAVERLKHYIRYDFAVQLILAALAFCVWFILCMVYD